MTLTLTTAEVDYLRSQRIGRLATVDSRGAPQNSPVGYRIDRSASTVDIGGYNLGKTRKFRNVRGNPYVCLVVDDLPSVDPWRVRGVEIRGTAEAIGNTEPPAAGVMSPEVIRIIPLWIGSWGLDEANPGIHVRRTTDESVA
ncbi:PPOX class F420-dependent oxidoreductase [Prauserella halophila]|uniref:PPOX class F420-dependent oxidoreductase n=1 Tax=Prauserella halophila TaxID=185641 RepID=A0ABP4H733_9PSEU|nr:PPOX class F420-dependent oxidoreductase [Prauserella halophila]MCP2237754.1 pyridoxamine 5'-phosphate oxidase family protein [Prauserella halophila]